MDSSLILSTATDGIVRLWDASSGAAVGVSMHVDTKSASLVTLSSNGRWLATAWYMTLWLWDVAEEWRPAVSPLNGNDLIRSVTFSHDGQLVAAGDQSGWISIWRIHTAERVHALKVGISDIIYLAFSPDATHIVFSAQDIVARVWDVSGAQLTLVLEGHTKPIQSVAWSLDGHFICTGSGDYKLRLWDAKTGTSLATLHGHTGEVNSVVFTSNEQSIISGSDDGTVRVWDVKAACSIASGSCGNAVAALAGAALVDGWLVGSSGELLLWVPAEYRGYLQLPPCTLRIGRSRVVIGVGTSGLHAGSNWSSCWRS